MINELHIHHTILGLLRGIKNASLREDLYQEAWLAVLEDAAVYARHPEWGSWRNTAYRVARWSILGGLKQRREEPLCEALVPDARRTPPVDVKLDAEVYLTALDESDRLAIGLRFWHGLTFKEIGLQLGMTGEAARQRIERILASLRRLDP